MTLKLARIIMPLPIQTKIFHRNSNTRLSKSVMKTGPITLLSKVRMESVKCTSCRFPRMTSSKVQKVAVKKKDTIKLIAIGKRERLIPWTIVF
ncbi:Uncharacterised protein [Streptococcus anginosus]|nr:Uncharacterised protein [Streptococcus anginosus]